MVEALGTWRNLAGSLPFYGTPCWILASGQMRAVVFVQAARRLATFYYGRDYESLGMDVEKIEESGLFTLFDALGNRDVFRDPDNGLVWELSEVDYWKPREDL